MRKLIFLLLTLTLVHNVNAQDADTKYLISAGFGVPNIPRAFFNTLGNEKGFTSTGKGPYHLKFEYKPLWYLGIGLNINNVSYKVNYYQDVVDTVNGKAFPNKVTIDGKNTAVNVRLNFHFLNPENNEHHDVYFGLGMGYRFGKLKVSSEYEQYTPSIKLPNLFKLGFETTFGYRYFITKNIGVYSELGLAKSVLQMGVTAAF